MKRFLIVVGPGHSCLGDSSRLRSPPDATPRRATRYRDAVSTPEVLWSPPADDRDRSRMGRLPRGLGPGRPVIPRLRRRVAMVGRPTRPVLGFVWDFFEVVSHATPTAVSPTPRCPARLVPRRPLNYAEHALRLPGARTATSSSSGDRRRAGPRPHAAELRDAVARCRAGLQRLGVGRGDRVGRIPAEHPGGGRRVPRDGEPRRDLVVVRAGVRDARRHRPLRADRAARAARRRRLPLRRPRRSTERGGRGDPRRAADARGDGDRPLPRRRRGTRAPGRRPVGDAARGRRRPSSSSRSRSTTRCTSSTRRAPPGCQADRPRPRRDPRSSTSRRWACTRTSGPTTASSGSRRPAG